MKKNIDYWFTIEPYVHVNVETRFAILYNTLDGKILESNSEGVIELIQETLKEGNCGVAFLPNEKYVQNDINDFVNNLRENYMGDVIDISLTKGKPVQLLPYFNFPDKLDVYKRHNFSKLKNVLENLTEINLHVDLTTDVTKLITFLNSVPVNLTINILGNINEVENRDRLLSFLVEFPSVVILHYSYKNVIFPFSIYKNNFSLSISVQFPIDIEQWNHSRKLILDQELPTEYVFCISSEKDHKKVEQIVKQYQVVNYRLNPVYNGNNIHFFEENVFLTKEDILSTPMTIKDIFARQAMNIYDYGKINVLSNGDAYANLNYPVLGNIYRNSIYEIVQKEVNEGKSWFRIRNQEPCNKCAYQWLCPPPSNYEIDIGRPNLCHVKNK